MAKHALLRQSDDVRRRAPKSQLREIILQFLIPILIPVIVIVGIRIWVVGVNKIPSASMEDTLLINDRIFTSKLTPGIFPVQRGDVITFDDPGNWLSQEEKAGGSDLLIKRVIGLPGDHVQCCNASGEIEINGQAIDEKAYLKSGVAPSTIPFDVTVPAGHLWVMGDNRANSADSRYHMGDGATNGFVPISDVQGVAEVVYWPISDWRSLHRPSNVFKDVPNPSS
jgi:signal peptidase I